jgi:dTMP kinase
MSLFITFEGGEGSGKSTQARLLYNKLKLSGREAVLLREPGGTPLGERVRHLLKKSTEIEISSLTELILFNASRSQLVSDVIKPALSEGKIVICDRFSDSTLAYQSYGRGLAVQLVREINDIAAQGLVPDLTILLDVAPGLGLSRKPSAANDRFELENTGFHERVRQGFIILSAENPSRWLIISATLPVKQIAQTIWQTVAARLK